MSETPMQEFWVERGADRLDPHLGNSITEFFFKVTTEDSHGGLLVAELAHRVKGGPNRHIHNDQDEWFYVVEGEYVFEVGQMAFRLKPGDSAFGPRKVPHVWAHVGDQPGRILSIIAPAGQTQAFFRTIAEQGPPGLDRDVFHDYGLELAGPPLAVE